MTRRLALGSLLSCLALLPVAAALGAGEVKLPAYKSATLPNGAVVALVEKRDTPLVSMNVTVRGGGLGDPAGKDGTASLFTDLIQKGAGNRQELLLSLRNIGRFLVQHQVIAIGERADEVVGMSSFRRGNDIIVGRV